MTGLPIWLVHGEGKTFVRSRLAPLPTKAPPCWPSQREWNEYKFLCDWQANHKKLARTFTYCTDCTPEYRDEMKRQGRCRFTATTFVTVGGVVEGRRG